MRESRDRREESNSLFYYLEITRQNCIRTGGYVIYNPQERIIQVKLSLAKLFFYCCNLPLPCPVCFNESLSSVFLRFCLTGRIKVLVPKDRVDGGVGELLPHEDRHLLQVPGRVLIPHPSVGPAVSASRREVETSQWPQLNLDWKKDQDECSFKRNKIHFPPRISRQLPTIFIFIWRFRLHHTAILLD